MYYTASGLKKKQGILGQFYSQHWYSAYHIPDNILSAFHKTTYLIFPTNPDISTIVSTYI